MDDANVKVRGGNPDPPPVLVSLENGRLTKGWTDEDEARWTTNAPATPPRS